MLLMQLGQTGMATDSQKDGLGGSAATRHTGPTVKENPFSKQVKLPIPTTDMSSQDSKQNPSRTKMETLSGSDSREIDPEANPTLLCKLCSTPIKRKEYGNSSWEHEDDEIVLLAGKVKSTSKYDHQATPNFIDTTSREE